MKKILLILLFTLGCNIPTKEYIPFKKVHKELTASQFLMYYSDSELYYRDFAYIVYRRWEWHNYKKYLIYYRFKRFLGEHPKIQTSKRNNTYYFDKDYHCDFNCKLKHIHFKDGLPKDSLNVPYIFIKSFKRPIMGARCISDNYKKRKSNKRLRYSPSYSCPKNCFVDHLHYTNNKNVINNYEENGEIDCMICLENRSDIWILNKDDICDRKKNRSLIIFE